VKRILLILMIIAIIGIMALPAMAWDGYPETPLSNEYDSSFIYQVILSKGNNTMLVVSQTKFYKEGDMLSEDRIRTSSTIHVLNYINEDWVYSGSLVSSQGVYFDEIIQSTHNIYMDETLTSVFFSATRKTPMQKALTQRPPLSLMSPLIRGISPFLIGLLIALVAFLKGLQLLFKTLRKA